MNLYDDVKKYESQVARKKYIKENLPQLREKKSELEKTVEELGKKKKSEDNDVKRLEGYTFTALVCSMFGKKDEKLDKEKAEAYEATAKYELAVNELEDINKEIKVMEYDLECYIYAEKKYEEAINKWIESVSSCPLTEDAASQIRSCQVELGLIRDKRDRIKESKRVAGKAISKTQVIISNLEEAKGWGIFDLILNQGYYADYSKYEKLDKVEADLRELNTDLYKIKDELKGINDTGQLLLTVTNDNKIADMYLDNAFVEIAQMDEIKKSKKNAEVFLNQLEQIYENISKKDDDLFEKETMIAKKMAEILDRNS